MKQRINFTRNFRCRVAAVAQWVKNPTAAALVNAVVQGQSPAWYSELKDPQLPQLQRTYVTAVTQIQSLELLYSSGAAITKKKLQTFNWSKGKKRDALCTVGIDFRNTQCWHFVQVHIQ